jgi:outer membrane receptor protein involved in Fe transport
MASVRLKTPTTLDLSLFKSFSIMNPAAVQFRLEVFNLTNRTYLGAPNTALTNSSFGQQSTAQINDPRTVQLALRLQF